MKTAFHPSILILFSPLHSYYYLRKLSNKSYLEIGIRCFEMKEVKGLFFESGKGRLFSKGEE
jgi:hypothetical protein